MLEQDNIGVIWLVFSCNNQQNQGYNNNGRKFLWEWYIILGGSCGIAISMQQGGKMEETLMLLTDVTMEDMKGGEVQWGKARWQQVEVGQRGRMRQQDGARGQGGVRGWMLS